MSEAMNANNALSAMKESEKQMAVMKDLAMKILPEEAKIVVEAAKKSGISPYLIQLGEEYFVYRTMNRLEYKDFLMTQAKQAEALIKDAESETSARILTAQRAEDNLVIRCTLYPKIDELSIKSIPAGYIETLHNTIMSTTGFGQEVIPIKL